MIDRCRELWTRGRNDPAEPRIKVAVRFVPVPHSPIDSGCESQRTDDHENVGSHRGPPLPSLSACGVGMAADAGRLTYHRPSSPSRSQYLSGTNVWSDIGGLT